MTTNTQTIAASPAKLRNGEWGARPSQPVSVGDIVRIKTRGGKEWDARVIDVSPDGSLCATQSLDRRSPSRAPARSRSYTSVCCGYPCPVSGRRCTAADPCHDCL